MVKRVVTQLEGLRELDQVLRQLPERMGRTALRQAVMAGAQEIVKEARAKAPRGAGSHGKHLYKSIVRQRVKDGGTDVTFGIGPTRDAFWGLFQEFGTINHPARPWMRPAFDAAAPRALRRMTEHLARGLARAAERLAGPYVRSGLRRR